MSESFSDLWASSNPVKSQQAASKTLGAAVNTSLNAPRRTTPDAFSMLASAGSSQPNSRPITPSSIRPPASSKTTPSNAEDAFGGLVSFGGSTSRDGGLTIAERAARADKERKEKAEREHAALKSQGVLWDQFEKQSTRLGKEAAPSNSSGGWDLDLLTSEPIPPSKPSQPTRTNGNSWNFDLITSEPEISVTPPATKSSKDILDMDDFATFVSPQPTPKEPSRSNTPGSFDFGDREDTLLGDGEDETDDILGSLAKPVESLRRASSTSTSKTSSPAPMPSSPSHPSPPPHILGRIVEMGFSVQQAKVALAATSTGLDVDAALEILLQSAPTEPDERDWKREEEEAEAERKRKRRQGPSRSTVFPTSSSSSPPTQQHSQQGIQDQADKLLAQASTIGLNMFNKANAFWKEGREKVVKVYEEQRTGGMGGDPAKGKGKPRWMDQTLEGDDEATGAGDARLQEHRSAPSRTSPTTSQPQLEPSRRHPPSKASTLTPALALKGSTLTPALAAPPVSRPNVVASSSALATSHAHKAAGTDHFKLGRFAEADTAYSSAIDALPPSHLLLVPLYNNRALTRLRTGDYKGTVTDATEVVSIVTDFAWHPGMQVGETAGVDLGDALGKGLRRRAEAYEGIEKWNEAMSDWERLRAAAWVSHAFRGDAVKGAGRCRRMAAGEFSRSAPAALSKPKPTGSPAPGPSEALSRVRAANTAQEVEDQARHDLKDDIDARLMAWRGGKETNLRALIASLDTILWPELGWQKLGMAELVSPGQVKVRYTKAIAKLHPDKLNINNTTLEQRMIANGVFGTLNEAWNAFK